MAIDKIIKSNRLLQSRRYTVASLTDSQESFTSVLDINAGEVYSQTNLIPTSSLPFSGSSQNGSILSVGGEQILKYYYRQTMTPSNVVSGSFTDAYFFISPAPGGTVTPQLLQTNQQNNFISAKYAVPALANSDAEDNPPGYNAVVFVNGTKQNPASYQFDYKNGVLQFLTVAPSTGATVAVTAYQYIGKTLASDQTLGYSGSFSGSFEGSSTGLFTGIGSGSFSGSFEGSSTGLFTGIGSGSFSGSFEGSADLNSLTVTGTTTLTGNTDRIGSLSQDGNLTVTGSILHTGSYDHIGDTVQTGSIFLTGSIDVVGPIISNGINVVDNAIAMAIALG
jgi:hypothetical protein